MGKKPSSATGYLDGRNGHQVGVRLGQGLGQLQVQHTARHGPHPPQGAGSLLKASTQRTGLGRSDCLDPLKLWNFSVLPRVRGRGRTSQRGPAALLIHLLTVPGRGLVLVDLRVEDSPVDHLLLPGFVNTRQRLASSPGEGLCGSCTDHDAELGRLQQAAVAVDGGVGALLVVVEMVGRVRGFTSRRRAVQEAGKLLGDAALPAVLRGRSRVPLVRAVVRWEGAGDKKTELDSIERSSLRESKAAQAKHAVVKCASRVGERQPELQTQRQNQTINLVPVHQKICWFLQRETEQKNS